MCHHQLCVFKCEARKKSFRAGRILVTAATAVCHVCMAFGPWTLAAGNGEWKQPWRPPSARILMGSLNSTESDMIWLDAV